MNKNKISEMLLEVKDYILTNDWDKVLKELSSSYNQDDLIEFKQFLAKEYPEYTINLTRVPMFTFFEEAPERIDLSNAEVIDSYAFYLIDEADVYVSKNLRNVGKALDSCNRITIHYPGTLEEWKKIGFDPLWFGSENDGTMLECSDGAFFIRENSLGEAKYQKYK